MQGMRRYWTTFLPVLAVAIASMGLSGCGDDDEHPKSDHPKKSEQPKPDHPQSEHPK